MQNGLEWHRGLQKASLPLEPIFMTNLTAVPHYNETCVFFLRLPKKVIDRVNPFLTLTITSLSPMASIQDEIEDFDNDIREIVWSLPEDSHHECADMISGALLNVL